MFALASSKARTGATLGNPVLATEGRVTLIDGLLAVAVLAGLLLNAGWAGGGQTRWPDTYFWPMPPVRSTPSSTAWREHHPRINGADHADKAESDGPGGAWPP